MRALGHLAVAAVAITAAGLPARADAVNWDAIAQCESSGNWHIANGGGLQIKPQTWWANGGFGLPEWAPKAEQIRVAEKIKDSQGLGAWPTCGAKGDAPGAPRPGSITDILQGPTNSQGACWLLLRCH